MTDPRTFADTCICLAVRKAGRTVGRAYDDAFRPLGINNGQFSILMFVSAERPTTIGMLADELAIDSTTATAVLKPLIRDKLLVLKANPDDARSRLIRLTTHGRHILAQGVPLWLSVQASLIRLVSAAELRTLKDALRKMT